MARMRPTIILFGDSITQLSFGEAGGYGWGSLLSSSYQRRADVINRGFSGYNTNLAIDLIPKVFQKEDASSSSSSSSKVLFCTLFFGANDASIATEPQHVPLDTYKSNVRKLITMIREQTASSPPFPIILMTPPPLDDNAWKAWREIDYCCRTNVRAREYGLAAQSIAQDTENCYCVDTWKALGGDGPVSEYGKHLSDGLHLSNSGNELIYEALMALLRKELPDLAPMEDGFGKHGTTGIPEEEELWQDIFGIKLE
mmetsp:Transcript_14119/g.38877  ORF Transcript_14119/g.38877 Transcript_14119/m.38877 type:complete len:256 (-) Transcript_14119:544-1311(-)